MLLFKLDYIEILSILIQYAAAVQDVYPTELQMRYTVSANDELPWNVCGMFHVLWIILQLFSQFLNPLITKAGSLLGPQGNDGSIGVNLIWKTEALLYPWSLFPLMSHSTGVGGRSPRKKMTSYVYVG